MRTSVIVSANAEWRAVKETFPDAEIYQTPFGESFCLSLGNFSLTVYYSGWGKIASAATMQYVIDRDAPDLVVNLGTCGGFEGLVNQGDIVLVERTLVYDIVELMGDVGVQSFYETSLDLDWIPLPYPQSVRRGVIASADSDLPPEKIPYLKGLGAIAGDWESAALAWTAKRNNARLLILRGVSDLVNEREGEAYDNIELFHERTKTIMRMLFGQLGDWLDSIGSALSQEHRENPAPSGKPT